MRDLIFRQLSYVFDTFLRGFWFGAGFSLAVLMVLTKFTDLIH